MIVHHLPWFLWSGIQHSPGGSWLGVPHGMTVGQFLWWGHLQGFFARMCAAWVGGTPTAGGLRRPWSLDMVFLAWASSFPAWGIRIPKLLS